MPAASPDFDAAADETRLRATAVRALVASDIRLYREGLTDGLARSGRVEVVGTAADAGTAVAHARGLAPDVVLVDLVMAGWEDAVRAIVDGENEPADRVEAQLTERGVTVRREPYNPRSRSLLSDLVGFRTPDPGSTVTLFEDDEGQVRYYTVGRPDPEVAQIRTEVAQLQEVTKALEPARLEHIERRLAKVDELESKVEALPELEERA